MIQKGDTVYYRTRVKGKIFTILGEVLNVDSRWATIERLNGHKKGKTENIKTNKLHKMKE